MSYRQIQQIFPDPYLSCILFILYSRSMVVWIDDAITICDEVAISCFSRTLLQYVCFSRYLWAQLLQNYHLFCHWPYTVKYCRAFSKTLWSLLMPISLSFIAWGSTRALCAVFQCLVLVSAACAYFSTAWSSEQSSAWLPFNYYTFLLQFAAFSAGKSSRFPPSIAFFLMSS